MQAKCIACVAALLTLPFWTMTKRDKYTLHSVLGSVLHELSQQQHAFLQESFGHTKMAFVEKNAVVIETSDPFVFIKPKVSAVPNAEEFDVIREAMSNKATGNEYFNGKNYIKAVEEYDKAIHLLVEFDVKKCARELAICYQNRSAANEKMRKFIVSVQDATYAIDADHTYGKGYYRRASAYMSQNKLYCALQDIIWACILDRFRNKVWIKMMTDINDKFGEFYLSTVAGKQQASASNNCSFFLTFGMRCQLYVIIIRIQICTFQT